MMGDAYLLAMGRDQSQEKTPLFRIHRRNEIGGGRTHYLRGGEKGYLVESLILLSVLGRRLPRGGFSFYPERGGKGSPREGRECPGRQSLSFPSIFEEGEQEDRVSCPVGFVQKEKEGYGWNVNVRYSTREGTARGGINRGKKEEDRVKERHVRNNPYAGGSG